MIRPRRTVPPAFAAHSRKPFRITFFGDPYPLTPMESHSYEKGGRGALSSPKLVRSSLPPNRAQTRHTRHARVAATPITSCACAHFPSPMGVALHVHFPSPHVLLRLGARSTRPPLRCPGLVLFAPQKGTPLVDRQANPEPKSVHHKGLASPGAAHVSGRKFPLHLSFRSGILGRSQSVFTQVPSAGVFPERCRPGRYSQAR